MDWKMGWTIVIIHLVGCTRGTLFRKSHLDPRVEVLRWRKVLWGMRPGLTLGCRRTHSHRVCCPKSVSRSASLSHEVSLKFNDSGLFSKPIPAKPSNCEQKVKTTYSNEWQDATGQMTVQQFQLTWSSLLVRSPRLTCFLQIPIWVWFKLTQDLKRFASETCEKVTSQHVLSFLQGKQHLLVGGFNHLEKYESQ